jgi:hypothetical protein
MSTTARVQPGRPESTPLARDRSTPLASRRRHELITCLALALMIVLLQAYIPLTFEQYFDSDQAVYGLMAKHLSEGRAFPLYFYGQNYLLGVQSWLAVPAFWIGGPTVAMLRTPLVLLNLSVAFGFTWALVRLGLRPALALIAALPVIAFTPVKAMEFAAAYGAGIEPFLYVLALWWLRSQPLAFGALLGFGTLHREFTFLALPAIAVALWPARAERAPAFLLRLAGGFGVVWFIVDVIKRQVNIYGPPGGTWETGSVTLGAQTFAQWLSFDLPAYIARIWTLLVRGVPDMLGASAYSLRTYSFPSDLSAGSSLAGGLLAVALVVAAARLLWRRWSTGAPPADDSGRFTTYLTAVALLNVLLYGVNGGIDPADAPILRYALFTPLFVTALSARFFLRERSRPWVVAVSACLVLWALGSVVDNSRLIAKMTADPPPRSHRIMASYLMNHGIRYARANYWDAYVITFLSGERVIVASTTTVRVSAYQSEVDAHADTAVTLVRQPCDQGVAVAAWCVVGPAASVRP